MKKIKLVLALSLTMASTFAFALEGNGDIGSGDSSHLQLKCSLQRRYFNNDGKAIQESLTPPEISAKAVEIMNDSDEKTPLTVVKFDVQTPDGKIALIGKGYAIVTSEGSFEVETSVDVELVEQKVFLHSSNTRGTNGKDFFKLDERNVKVIAYKIAGVGKTKDGLIANQYISICEVFRD